MMIVDLLIELKKMFPRSPIDAWESAYRAALANAEGERLREAYAATMLTWEDPGAPKPAHFARNLPPLPADPNAPPPKRVEQDARRRVRAVELELQWTREAAGWLETGKAEGWSGHLRKHLRDVAHWCAHCEVDHGRDLMDAIARYNGRDRRGNHANRDPLDLYDETDIAIFRSRLASQKAIAERRAAVDAGAVGRRDRMRRQIEAMRRNVKPEASGEAQ